MELNEFGLPTHLVLAKGTSDQVEYSNKYYPNGNLEWSIAPDPASSGTVKTSYEYHADYGTVTKVIHPDQTVESWTYDADYAFVTSYTDELGRVTEFQAANESKWRVGNTIQRGAPSDPGDPGKPWQNTSNRFDVVPDGIVDMNPNSPTGDWATLLEVMGNHANYDFIEADGELNAWTSGLPYLDVESIATPGRLAPLDLLAFTRLGEFEGEISDSVFYTRKGNSGLNPYQVPAGLVERIVDPLGRETTFQYYSDQSDAASYGLLEQVQTPYGTTFTYRYNERGLVESVSLAFRTSLGSIETRHTKYEYGRFDLLTKETLPYVGNLDADIDTLPGATYHYLENGLLESTTDAEGMMSTFGYDTIGEYQQLTEINLDVGVGGINATTYRYYDDAGNLTMEIDPESNATTYQYDALNRLSHAIAPEPDPELDYPEYQNPVAPWDVNADGQVDERDEALVSAAIGESLEWPLQRGQSFNYVDVDGNGVVDGADLTAIEDSIPIVVDNSDRPITELDYHDDVLYSTQIADAVTSYEYDKRGRMLYQHFSGHGDEPQLTETTYTSFTYDDAGQLKTSGVFGESLTEYTYDPYGRLLSEASRIKLVPGTNEYETAVWSYTHDDAGNPTTITDPEQLVTHFNYRDDRDLLDSIEYVAPGMGSEHLGETVRFYYDGLNQLRYHKSIVGEDTRTTEIQYDILGRAVTTLLPHAQYGQGIRPVTRSAYDNVGNLLFQIDAVDNITEYQYDSMHRLQYVIGDDPDRSSSPATPTANLDPNAVRADRPVVEFVYDDASRNVQTIDALARTSETVYDRLSRTLLAIQPDPESGLPEIDGDSSFVSYSYNRLGDVTIMENGEGDTTEYLFDNLSRLRRQKRAGNGFDAITFEYDERSNVESIRDREGNKHVYEYDLLNRRISEGRETELYISEFEYDKLGNLVEKIDREGRQTNYRYDDNYRLRFEEWIGDAGTPINTIEFTYDAFGRPNSSSDQDHFYNFTYDDLDRMRQMEMSVTGLAASIVIDRGFDAQNQTNFVVSATNNTGQSIGGFKTKYDYDHLNRVDSITQTPGVSGIATNKFVDYEYRLDGSLEQISRYDDWIPSFSLDSLDTNFSYDQAGRLHHGGSCSDCLAISHSFSDSFSSGYDFEYDRANRIVAFDVAANPNESVSNYSYDWESQLTRSESDIHDEIYFYDGNGNRRLIDSSIRPDYEYNEITASQGYEYDNNGNMTRRPIGGEFYEDVYGADYGTGVPSQNIPDAFQVLEWDHRNRLTKVTSFPSDSEPASSVVEYRYDSMNQLIGKTLTEGGDSVETYFVYESGQIVMELEATGNADESVTHNYLWGPGVDQLLADESVSGANTSYEWALTDHLGTIRDWVAPDGTLTEHLAYDSFGNVLNADGTRADLNQLDHLFGYTGRMLDTDTELQNNLNRWYDAKVGKWISEDPIGFAAGDSNLYRYVGNSPTNKIDPNGLQEVSKGARKIFVFDFEKGYYVPYDPTSPPPPTPLMNALEDGKVTDKEAASLEFAPWEMRMVLGDKYDENCSYKTNKRRARLKLVVDSSKKLQIYSRIVVPTAELIEIAGALPLMAGNSARNAALAPLKKLPADKWSRIPKSFQDQMALKAAKEGKGKLIIENLGDPKFRGMEKWECTLRSDKFGKGAESVVHYVRDPRTGKLMDFKFKKHSSNGSKFPVKTWDHRGPSAAE